MELPIFKYHPDPIGTGAIEKTEDECECCEKPRGCKATSTIYSVYEVETICPWCIADGSAATKFDGSFSDSHPLLTDGIDQHIVKEVCERTPSFISWQQERWLSHCNDACEFHGDATKADLESLSGEALKEFLSAEYIKEDIWPNILAGYEKGGGLATLPQNYTSQKTPVTKAL
ncbi:CbrC family protein [Alteromonas stellipolaris]|uniref:CbrC family protein n=1 Tax=Alteromonas stellipolaris TaxID=233316 RepID=UPI002732534C|nr:CbrC family protein [Alteromonas stellipolaris]MDP2596006.1 CbrC family protein [Alteromonas stellipolaris]